MALDYKKCGFTKYKIAYEPWVKFNDWSLYGQIGNIIWGEWYLIGRFESKFAAKSRMEKIAAMEQPEVEYYDKDGLRPGSRGI